MPLVSRRLRGVYGLAPAVGLALVSALPVLAAPGSPPAPAAPPEAAPVRVAPAKPTSPLAAAGAAVTGAVFAAAKPVLIAPCPPDVDCARARHVLIISEDGMRPDFITTAHLPWHELLYHAGAYSWKARTIRTASTLPAHAAMLSGFDVPAHGLTWNNWRPSKGYIKVHTIFDEATEHGMKTAMFVGKNKLKHIATPGTVEVFERPGYYCKKVADEAAAYLTAEKPPLMFVHFSDPDEAGHASGWASEKYRHSVAQTDKCLGVILEALDRNGLAESTLVILSADHGGHNHTHSGALLIDREIPWIARGPGVRADYKLHGPISTVDTAATALYALGLPISALLAGKPVKEIYGDPIIAGSN